MLCREKVQGVCNAFQVSLDLLSVSVVSRGFFLSLTFQFDPCIEKDWSLLSLHLTWSTQYCQQMIFRDDIFLKKDNLHYM